MRVKTGTVRHTKHQKTLRAARGYRMTKNRLYKVAHEAELHAGQYAFAGRKNRKRDFRQLWISRLNAALKPYDLKYNQFIALMTKNKIDINRKILANLALDDPQAFATLVEKVTAKEENGKQAKN